MATVKRFNFYWLGLFLIAGACGTLLVLAMASVVATGPLLVQDRLWVAHTRAVIDSANEIKRALRDAERGQRGFLIAGNDAYLDPYRQAAEQMPSLVGELARLTQDNPEQTARVEVLKSEIATKLDELDRSIALMRDRGFDASREMVLTDRGRKAMIDADRTIDDLIELETKLLASRRAKVAADQEFRETATTVSAILALILMILGAIVLHRAYRAVGIAERARRDTEVALAQMQKMDALGQLTGGVAHDFNNLLHVVSAAAEMLIKRMAPDASDQRRLAESIRAAARRGADLTLHLLAFARRQPLDPKPVDINRMIGSTSELLRRVLGERIAVETVLAGGLWPSLVDIAQLEASIVNLAVNARDAMPDSGKLTIETANAYLDEAYASRNVEVASGQYVMIAVSDTGFGMSPDTVSRAFEPFFTTKEVGKGTGLGLAQVHGFIKQSGGHVKIYSEPGAGTTVKIYLPRLVGVTVPTPLSDSPPPQAEMVEGVETVLVVEDDVAGRQFTAEMLGQLGYTVLQAGDAHDALHILEGPAPIDLLFTDVGLPGGVNGRQLADAAAKLRPGLRILFTTAYARNAIIHHGRLDPGVELIVKPFTINDVARKLRKVLERATLTDG